VGSTFNGCALAQSAVTFASVGSIKASGPGHALEDVAPAVTASVASDSVQRFALASLSLEWSLLSDGNTGVSQQSVP
jgi:hypothetical protein